LYNFAIVLDHIIQATDQYVEQHNHLHKQIASLAANIQPTYAPSPGYSNGIIPRFDAIIFAHINPPGYGSGAGIIDYIVSAMHQGIYIIIIINMMIP